MPGWLRYQPKSSNDGLCLIHLPFKTCNFDRRYCKLLSSRLNGFCTRIIGVGAASSPVRINEVRVNIHFCDVNGGEYGEGNFLELTEYM